MSNITQIKRDVFRNSLRMTHESIAALRSDLIRCALLLRAETCTHARASLRAEQAHIESRLASERATLRAHLRR